MYFCVTLLTQFITIRVYNIIIRNTWYDEIQLSTNCSPKNEQKFQQKLKHSASSRVELFQDRNTQSRELTTVCLLYAESCLGHKTSRLHNFHLPLDYSLYVSTHHFGQGAYSPPWTWRKNKDKCIVGGLLKIDSTCNLQKTSPRQIECAISLHFTTIDRTEQIIPVSKGQENINIDFV